MFSTRRPFFRSPFRRPYGARRLFTVDPALKRRAILRRCSATRSSAGFAPVIPFLARQVVGALAGASVYPAGFRAAVFLVAIFGGDVVAEVVELHVPVVLAHVDLEFAGGPATLPAVEGIAEAVKPL
jgi:hypothetical protein